MRLSGEQAAAMGLVSQEEAKRIDGSSGRPSGATQASMAEKGRAGRAPDAPQALLFDLVRGLYPDEAVEEYRPLANRRIQVDVALPAYRIAIECDGWQFHGQQKGDFARDRERTRALAIGGWHLLPFTAGEIRKQPDLVREAVQAMVATVSG